MNVCACWGELLDGRVEHPDCDVIVTTPGQAVESQRAGPFPRLCACECATCKRAWWDAGRPALENGVISRAP